MVDTQTRLRQTPSNHSMYTNSGTALPTVMVTGQLLGISQSTPPSNSLGAHVPSNESTKSMLIKVQKLPLNWEGGALFVYTEERDYMCSVCVESVRSDREGSKTRGRRG